MFNRDIRRLQAQAETIARARIMERPEMPWPQGALGGMASLKEARVLDAVAHALGVPKKSLHPNDVLGALLRVNSDELGDGAEVVLAKYGFRGAMTVLIVKVLAACNDAVDSKSWHDWLEVHPEVPTSEDDWIDFAASMKLRDLVSLFAPHVSGQQASSAR